MIQGSNKEQYAKLWDYCQEIKRTNPYSTVELKVSHEDGENGQPRFERLYVCHMKIARKRGFGGKQQGPSCL